MASFGLGSDRCTNCRAQGAADNGTVAPAHFVTNSRTGCSPQATAYGGVQRGIPGVGQGAEKNRRQSDIFCILRDHRKSSSEKPQAEQLSPRP
jgi:hypothetical protein